MDNNRDGRPPSTSPRLPTSAYSPFPFGSIIMSSDRTLLTPGHNGSMMMTPDPELNLSGTNSSHNVIRGRVRAQDVYGGQLMFGGNASTLRRNRLLSASPYQAAASLRLNRFNRSSTDSNATTSKPSNAPTPSTSKSTTPTSDDGMSSTARLILDTLEKMSTPVRDALKIPIVARAEKRRQIMSELESSLMDTPSSLSSSSKRRRPNLSAYRTAASTSLLSPHNRTLLNGPPVRSLVSPVVATPTSTQRLRAGPIPSARKSFSSTPSVTTPSQVPAASGAATKSFSSPFSSASSTKPQPPTSTFSFGNAIPPTSTTVTAVKDKASPSLFGSATNYQIPFSVPALSGSNSSSATLPKIQPQLEPVKPTASLSTPVSFSTGKVRARLGDKKSDLDGPDQQVEPLPPHLANPISSGLELKQLPSFGSGFFTEKKSADSTSPLAVNSQSSSTSTKTADTVLLSPERKSSTPSAQSSVAPTTRVPTFKFSDPVVVSSTPSTSESWSKMNGSSSSLSRFTFSEPVSVTTPAAASHHHSPSSSPSSISALKTNNNVVMPDLTFSTSNSKMSMMKRQPGDFAFPVQPLKTGSVMDILGGNSKLPDVTASTNSSLTSGQNNLGGFGSFASESSSGWDSKFKFGQNSWS